MKVNYLLVGQGIAGSCMYFTLKNMGYTAAVIDFPSFSRSSAIAGGLINPVGLQRLVKVWQADEQLAACNRFFEMAGKELNVELLHHKLLKKMIAGDEEKSFWEQRAKELQGFISEKCSGGRPPGTSTNIIGYGVVEHTARVDVQLFLNLLREKLIQEQRLLEEPFDHSLLAVSDTGISYKHLQADKIIFCEGHAVRNNPLFEWLPLRPTKGEILTLRSPVKINDIYSKGVFMLPVEEGLYKVGSTFNWIELDENPTVEAREEIMSRLRAFFEGETTLIKQEAAVRPTVQDRRPLAGVHPLHSNVGVFNGLGSKGLLIAPWLAPQLVHHMQNNATLDAASDIKRFMKRYYKSNREQTKS